MNEIKFERPIYRACQHCREKPQRATNFFPQKERERERSRGEREKGRERKNFEREKLQSHETKYLGAAPN